MPTKPDRRDSSVAVCSLRADDDDCRHSRRRDSAESADVITSIVNAIPSVSALLAVSQAPVSTGSRVGLRKHITRDCLRGMRRFTVLGPASAFQIDRWSTSPSESEMVDCDRQRLEWLTDCMRGSGSASRCVRSGTPPI